MDVTWRPQRKTIIGPGKKIYVTRVHYGTMYYKCAQRTYIKIPYYCVHRARARSETEIIAPERVAHMPDARVFFFVFFPALIRGKGFRIVASCLTHECSTPTVFQPEYSWKRSKNKGPTLRTFATNPCCSPIRHF